MASRNAANSYRYHGVGGGRGLWGKNALGGGRGGYSKEGFDSMDTTGYNKRGAIDDDNANSKRDKGKVLLRADNTPNDAAGMTNPNDDKRNVDIANRISQQGHDAVNIKGGFKSNIKMEWVMEKRESFNLCTAVIGAINAMRRVDGNITVKSKVTGEHWQKDNKIPMGDAFMHAFDAKQELFMKDKVHVIAYATIVLKFRLNIIKFDTNVFKFLQENKLYIKLDHFK